ncbi:MAG TPA: CHAT domain-containing protein [Chthoniobacterales bacterium]
MNDREILARLEAASPKQLAELLRRPSEHEARVYRAYFGPTRYDALRRRNLAVRGAPRAAKRGNVVILHGIMGGELTLRDKGRDQHIWMHLLRLVFGAVRWLRMKNGSSQFDVRATGILKKWYAEQILEFSYDWNTQTYWYDWRRDLDEIADDLRGKIDNWFGPEAPVHLVAHSMGGLVSRTYIARHPRRWDKGGKLVMLGTPNHGSFAIPQVITGVIDTVRKLELVDLKHNLAEITEILGGMPGALQMLPSPLVMPAMAPLYQSSTWAGRVPQPLLDRARKHHDFLAEIVDDTRMHYIAGCNRHTYDDIRNWKRLDALDGYSASMNGDGTVPHRLGFLEARGVRIPTWFIQEDHGALPNNTRVINAAQRLLLEDKCELSPTPEGARSVIADRAAARVAATGELTQRGEEEARLAELVERLRSRARSTDEQDAAAVSQDEIEATEILLRGFLSESVSRKEMPLTAAEATVPSTPIVKTTTKIEIALVLGDLANLPPVKPGTPEVDAISVGHYAGVAPQNAELALDRALSSWKKGDPDEKLVITALSQRGTIPAQLGQQYIIPDLAHPPRIAVLVGMGEAGKFRAPELTVAVRELAWTLGRLNIKHLASVLIGTGAGNIPIELAVCSWLRGLRRALFDALAVDTPALQRITFVENSPANFLLLNETLTTEIQRFKDDPEPLCVTYLAPEPEKIRAARETARQRAIQRAMDSFKDEASTPANESAKPTGEPVRFTVRLSKDTYEFSVLSTEAAIPQRNTTVDPTLIDQINNQLPIANSFLRQRDLGNLLGRMLLPVELRNAIVKPGIPTVLVVDATTARIHFELAALSPAGSRDEFEADVILGTAANLTRQLRTTFAPLPEPPLMAGRPLRVLVIADPCEEAPLPGAQEEGEAVAQLFDQLAESGANVEPPQRLFGPSEATRVAVLDCLINQRFDLVHYAGHCFYNTDDPPRSGWLFSHGEILSAYELGRIDRIPRFVFSNACESGITPDRADQRSAGLAPSFAEAFFARGVANFICTAWPVDDAAALAFATRVYRGLLGLPGKPEPLCQAMHAARLEIARHGEGGRATWGAYQHYGDPYFRLPLDRKHALPAAARKSFPTRRPRKSSKKS